MIGDGHLLKRKTRCERRKERDRILDNFDSFCDNQLDRVWKVTRYQHPNPDAIDWCNFDRLDLLQSRK